MKIGSIRLRIGLERFSGLYLMAAFIVIFGIWTPHLFLSKSTLHSVAADQAITGLLSLAVLVPLVCGAYDLSVGASINLAAVLAASLQTQEHWGLWSAVLVGFLSAVLIGCLNGFFVVVLKINSFIATLGMGTVVGAVQQIVTHESQPFAPSSNAWNDIGQRLVGGFQISVYYLLAAVLIVWWLLTFTPFGRYLYSIGGNAEAARLSGVRVGRLTWFSLIISGTLAGIAGVVYSSQSGPSLTFGAGLLLPAFAAAFLGSTQVRPGRFNVWGTVIAVYALATGVKGLQLVTGVQWLSDMFNGVALLVAVGFAVWRQGRARPATSTPPPKETMTTATGDVSVGAGPAVRSTAAVGAQRSDHAHDE